MATGPTSDSGSDAVAITPPPRPRSVLAIDVGKKRIGLAGCDPLGLTIAPLPAIARGKFNQDLTTIKPLVEQRRCQALIVGIPLDLDQNPTPQAEYCRRYGNQLALALCLPLAWVDEHCSSWSAAEKYQLHGDRSGALDSVAAALLLEQWLREGPEPVVVAAINQGRAASPEGS